MTDPKTILTEEQVAEIKDRGRPSCWTIEGYPNAEALKEYAELCREDIPELCASHEALRARVAELERLVEKPIIECRGFWSWNVEKWDAEKQCDVPVPHDEGCDRCREALAALANTPRPNNDAEIARLAREYVAAHKQWVEKNTYGERNSFNDAKHALIAAVQKEGN